MSTIESQDEQITKSVREVAEKLLAEGKVDLIIGYTDGTLPLRAQPLFIKDVDDVANFSWKNLGYINLAKYLLVKRKKKVGDVEKDLKVGIIAKGCVGRAVNHLIVEHQIKRENVVIIGFPCNGVIDVNRIEQEIGDKEVKSVKLEGDDFIVTCKDLERKFPVAEYLNSLCKQCKIHSPPALSEEDVIVGERESGTVAEDTFSDIAEYEAKPAEERWDEITSALKDCIRCYACRQACPMCYCNLCFVDQNKPIWFGKTYSMTDILNFHLVRANHMVGRCVACGACHASCPMNIDLNFITRKLEKIAKSRFNFVVGLDQETLPPLSKFSMKDKEDFMLDDAGT